MDSQKISTGAGPQHTSATALSVRASVAGHSEPRRRWSGQEKFTDLKSAKARAAQLVKAPAGTLKDESLHIIHDLRANVFFVEDGTPMIRNFEKCLWSL